MSIARPTTVYAAREGQRFSGDHVLVVATCPKCHIVYAIPESLDRAARKYPGGGPGSWSPCCPMGHNWHYNGESEETRLKAQLKRERERSGRLVSQLDQTRSETRAQKARATRFRNQRDAARQQQAAGTCPCCGKEFKVLAKHMLRMHPDFPAAGE